jgi:DNA-nicking Smr family endonuclease
MKRRTTDQERAEFKTHMDEPRPLKAVTSKTKPRKTAVAGGGGLDGNTKEKLKRGQLQPAARIDLHGMSEAAAHGALLSFLAGAQARGVRLALVVTGVGNPARDEVAEWMRPRHGVLKQMVPRWLNEKEFAALAVGTAPAHVRHGGDGALYVYLRKRA